MNITLISPPPTEPVTLAECYVHLRLDPDVVGSPPIVSHPDDAMLIRHIATATRRAEQITRRAFVQQTIRLTVPGFPRFRVRFGGGFGDDDDFESRPGWIELPRPPLIRVESVIYYDTDNALQTVDAANYFTTDDLVPRLQFLDSFAMPATFRRNDAVRIDYVVGYPPEGSPPSDYVANVPQPIKDAVLLGVQLLYDQLATDQREALENAREYLLASFRVHTY